MWLPDLLTMNIRINYTNAKTNKSSNYGMVMSAWSYGSDKYLCNQCLSWLKLWVRIPLMAMCCRYNIMW